MSSVPVPAVAAQKKVLVGDDDPLVIELLTHLLKKENIAVTTAPNGLEALRIMQETTFDLLIADVWMPEMDGLQLLSVAQKIEGAPPIIILTADQAPAIMLKAVREQAQHVVCKPFSASEMLDLIRETLNTTPAAPIEVLSSTPDWVELVVPCEVRSIDRIQPMLMRLKSDLPTEVRESIGQAFRELLLNAIEWGGKLDAGRKVRISFIRAQRMLLYRISDPGSGFRFEGLDHAAVSNAPDDPIGHMRAREEKGLRPGGLGILMTKSLVDELIYNETQNEVVLIKYLN
jgi:CheY-like chemotaxis protein